VVEGGRLLAAARIREVFQELGAALRGVGHAGQVAGHEPGPQQPAEQLGDQAADPDRDQPDPAKQHRGDPGLAVADLDHPRQARRHRRRAELGAGRAGDHLDFGGLPAGRVVGAATAYRAIGQSSSPSAGPSSTAPNSRKVTALSSSPVCSARKVACLAWSAARILNTIPATKAATNPLPPRAAASV
jgi:hypothetical protein